MQRQSTKERIYRKLFRLSLCVLCMLPCVMVGVWGLVDLGHGTLTEITQELFGVGQTGAAALVATAVAILAGIAVIPLISSAAYTRNDEG